MYVDNLSLKWLAQKRTTLIFSKAKEKVAKETHKRRPFTRFESNKLMRNAMKSNAIITATKKKKKKSGDTCFEIPTIAVVDISIEESKHEGVTEITK